MDEKQKPETMLPKARIERYPFTKPGGKVVTMEHNLETGETKIVGKAE